MNHYPVFWLNTKMAVHLWIIYI